MSPVPPILTEPQVPEVYADGVLDVGFGNGMVRIDLFSLSAVHKDEQGQPLPVVRQRVVMSLHGFLSSLAAMDGMRQRLEAAGVLVPAAAAQGQGAAAAGRPAEPPKAPTSPNFA